MAAVFDQPRTNDSTQRALQVAGMDSNSLNLLTITGERQNLAGDRRPRAAVRHGRAANDEIMHVLQEEVDKVMGRTPEWVPREMRNPDPNVQCASTASNIYREAMLASHVIESMNSPKYRGLTQVQVPNWVNAMKRAGLAEEISRDQIRPGDVVVGYGDESKNAANNDRHIGFVGEYDQRTKNFAAYSNSMGRLRHQDLEDRFGHYREEHYYRVYFPN